MRTKIVFMHNRQQIEAIAVMTGKFFRIVSGIYIGMIVETQAVISVE